VGQENFMQAACKLCQIKSKGQIAVVARHRHVA
jgi:hypothetical protein